MVFYTNILESRANCLLMSEDTMRFNQYNKKMNPKEISHFAVCYIISILNKLINHNSDLFEKDFKHNLLKSVKEYCPEFK